MSDRCYKTGQPCASCPWRTDQRAEDIPGFEMELADRLTATCADERGHGPSIGTPMFACHLSNDGEEFPCAGWLAIAGHRHPNVRLAVIQGRIAGGALKPGSDWPELHANYTDVLAKLKST